MMHTSKETHIAGIGTRTKKLQLGDYELISSTL